MINLEYFKTIFPDQPNVVKDIVKVTILEYPDFIKRFKSCLKNNNLYELKKLAHKWKYTASIFGLVTLESNLAKIENYQQLNSQKEHHLAEISVLQLESVYEELNQINS